MQEIKYRALRASTNSWVYGVNKPVEATLNTPNLFRMSKFWELVEVGQFKRSTVSQFIGAHDKNGDELYDGDIISRQGAYIAWSERLLCWCFKFKYADFETPLFHDPTWQKNCEKIGSRFLNPELLEGEK